MFASVVFELRLDGPANAQYGDGCGDSSRERKELRHSF